MISRLIHQTAPSPELAWEERQLRRRLDSVLGGWTIRLWTDGDNRALVAEHFPRFLPAYDAIERGVVKADIARLIYMHALGGFYLDTDYKLYRPFDERLRSHACILPIEVADFGDEAALRLGNSIFGSEPGYPFWSDFIHHVFEETLPRGIVSGQVVAIAGPFALTRFYLANRERYPEIYFPPQRAFHPNQQGRGPVAVAFDRQSYGIHLCWGSWRGKKSIQWLRNQARRKLSIL